MSSVATPRVALVPDGQVHAIGHRLSPQLELLLAASWPQTNERTARVVALLEGEVDWRDLMTLADRHGLIARLYQNLVALSARVPPDILGEMRGRIESNARQSLWLTQLLNTVLAGLESHGVRALAYKGPVLAEMLYQSVAMRQFSDLDIIVRAQELSRAKVALRELGFTSSLQLRKAEEKAYLASGYEWAFDSPGNKNLIELQWRILPRFYAVDFDIEGLFKRAQVVEVSGKYIRTFCPQDLLMVLCVHASKHIWARLSWIFDIAELARSKAIDWDEVKRQAKLLGIERTVAISLLLAQELLGAPAPKQFQQVFDADQQVKNLVDQIRQIVIRKSEYNNESLAYFRLMIQLRERWRDKLRFIARLAFTPSIGEWSLIRLPAPLFPLYRVLRFFRLARRLKPASDHWQQ